MSVMSSQTESGPRLYLNGTVTAQPIPNGDAVEIAWGEGTYREFFAADARLATLLLSEPSHSTFEEASARLAAGLGITVDDGRQLVTNLREYGLFRDEPRDLTAAEERWLDVSWHDALDLHLATHDMMWIHDYTGNPQVMTKYHIDKRVEPTTAPPPRFPIPADALTVALPGRYELPRPVDETMRERRTRRNFAGTRLELTDVATILDWSFRPQWPVDKPYYYATQTYSRGAPFTAFCVFQGDGSPAEVERDFSVYQYDPTNHCLVLRSKNTEIATWSDILWGQSYADGAPMALIIAVDWQQYMWKYRFSRAYRWAYYECGAVMQTALTVATALGVGAFQTPAIDDAKVCAMLDVKDTQIGPLYLASMGKK